MKIKSDYECRVVKRPYIGDSDAPKTFSTKGIIDVEITLFSVSRRIIKDRGSCLVRAVLEVTHVTIVVLL